MKLDTNFFTMNEISSFLRGQNLRIIAPKVGLSHETLRAMKNATEESVFKSDSLAKITQYMELYVNVAKEVLEGKLGD